MKTSLIICKIAIFGFLTVNIAFAITADELLRASALFETNNIKLNENMKIDDIRKWGNYTLVDVKQYYKDLPIINSTVIYKFKENGIAVVDRKGELDKVGEAINISNIEVNISPIITEVEAIEIFKKEAIKDRPYGSPIATLSIYNINSGISYAKPLYKLIWRVTTSSSNNMYILLDAETGHVYFYFNGIVY